MADYKVVLKGRLAGSIETRNVFYFNTAVEPSVSEWLGDMTAYFAALFTPIQPFVTTVWNAYGFDVHQWTGSPANWQPIMSGPLTVHGTATTDPFPSQVAAVLVAYTVVKRTFSRKFIAGVVESAFDGNVIVSGALAAFTSMLAVWIADFTAPSAKIYSPGLWSKSLTVVTFSQGIVDQLAGTMRRRKATVGI